MKAGIAVIFFILLALWLFLSINADAQQYVDIDLVLNDVNNARTERGLCKLLYQGQHQPSVDAWADHITTSLYHSSARFKGEVISQCIGSDELIVPLFLKSEPHKKILLDRQARGVCVSIVYVPGQTNVVGTTVEYIPGMYYTVIRTY